MSQEYLLLFDLDHFDPICNPTKTSHPYPLFSKVVDRPKSDKNLERYTYNFYASEQKTPSSISFLNAQSTTFAPKKQF